MHHRAARFFVTRLQGPDRQGFFTGPLQYPFDLLLRQLGRRPAARTVCQPLQTRFEPALIGATDRLSAQVL